ncbi:MAG: sulfatase [Flavobacterium sp.]|nr:sulfatase [Flavobacterium sp.]
MKKLIAASLLGILSFSPIIAQEKTRPNVLFIAVDDLKPLLGCYGNTLVKTPNIDRLAKMGTVFLNNYCQQAVCGPTRASLLTGMRPDVTKIRDLHTKMRDMNPNIVTLPEYFISQGYATSGVGKIFHPSCVDKKYDPQSWTIPFLVAKDSDYFNGPPVQKHYQSPELKALQAKAEVANTDVDGKGKKKGKKEDDDEEDARGPAFESLDLPDNAYDDGVSALIAEKQIIKLTKANKPFFMAVGFRKPHLPFVSPKKYWDLYKREDMPIAEFQEHAANSKDFPYQNSGEVSSYSGVKEYAKYTDKGVNKFGLAIEKQKELVHAYYAAVSYTDAQVGVLLNTLEKLGTLNNTIIVLWGDHGWHLGDHDMWGKHTNYEQATKAPLIIAAPGIKPGQSKSMTEFVDVFPTLCELAGGKVPTYLDGKSLVPVMKNNKVSVKEYAMSQYPRKMDKADINKVVDGKGKLMGYSMRTEQYRYTVWLKNFTSDQVYSADKVYTKELYDYVKDPLEKVNVSDDSKYAAIAADLDKKMVAYFKSKEVKL